MDAQAKVVKDESSALVSTSFHSASLLGGKLVTLVPIARRNLAFNFHQT
jgi:hypothetical protein